MSAVRELVWETTAITGNFANVPFNPITAYRRSRLNTHDFLINQPDLIAAEEMWWPLTRAAFYRVLKNRRRYRHHSAGVKQSVVIAWNTEKYALIREGWFLLHGVVAGRFGLVSDARKVPWVLLRDRATGRCLILAGIHPTPAGTRKGEAAARAASNARRAGYDRFAAWAKERGYPIIVPGDWNDPYCGGDLRARGLEVDGRTAVGADLIDRVLGFSSPQIEVDVVEPVLVPMSYTDHKGAVQATVRGYLRAA